LSERNVNEKELPGGLRVLSEPLKEATSISLGVWIRAGSRDERDDVAGITHLMEHMLFKGTPQMSALQIAEAFEGIGAQENAATGEEYTVLYARFLPEHLEKALDIMADMVTRPTLVDLEREREVIVEEIRMYEDRPDQMADEYLSGLIFHDDPLGRPIIGSAETVRGVNEDEFDDMLAWCGQHGFDLCLIETMPLGEIAEDRADQYLPLSLVKQRLDRRWTLSGSDYATGGPARYFDVAETGARLGLITPMTHNFCESCNRVRLTCTGTLYMCLGQEDAVDLRAPLRDPELGDEGLRRAILDGIARKPKGHDFVIERARRAPAVARHMSVTGG